MAEQRESRVWGDQGTEPDPGDEIYSGSERPIAEYDNWAMWSTTTDIKTLFDWLDSVESDLTDHTSSSTGVHGLASDDSVAGQSDVDLSVESHRQDETHDQPQPNQDHGNEDHTSTFAVDGDAQPPETHGNGSHTTNYSAEGHDHTETSESQLPDSALKEDYVTSRYTDEEAQDAAATALAGGDKVTIAYDDAGNSITIDTSALDAEEVESRINSVLSAGDKVSLSYDDTNDDLQIDTSALDAEEVEDQVSSLITGGSGISVSYDDANNTLTINGYTDANAVNAVDSEVDNAATSVSGLDDEVASNNSDISTLQSDKLDSADYNPESDTHSKFTDEEAQDAVAAALAGGDKVTIAYDDAGNSITIDTSALDAEEVEDQVNSVLTAGSNVSLNYDDASDTLTISSTDTDTQRTNEEIEDIVADLISAGSNVSVNYNDANDTLTLSSTDTDTQLSNEDVEDIVASLITGGDGTSVTYDDANDTLTISSSSNTAIDLLDVESPDDLPDPSAVSQPTIAYVDSEDDYVGVFKQ
jgi:ribulose bisphosphate carboxylase small subunit